MLSYNLAKELKDAGFPQDIKSGDMSCGCEDRMKDSISRGENIKLVFDCRHERVYIPTLSELIEACGKAFCSLDRLEDVDKWIATRFYPTYKSNSDDSYSLLVNKISTRSYNTPEEAVAHLWLDLNKHKA